MAAKRMDQLSTLSTVADSDLLLVYDVDEGGSEKTKSITYSEFETQISGAVGGGSSNPESLYYNSTDVKATATSAGISITDGTATAATIGFTADDLYIANNDPDGLVYLTAEKSGTGQANLFLGDPDGSTVLYYQGDAALTTVGNGVKVEDPGTTHDFHIRHVSGHWNLLAFTDAGENIQISATNDAAVEKDLFIGDPDGAVELYHAGVKKFETTAGGVTVTGAVVSTGSALYLNSDGGGSAYVRNNAEADIYIQVGGQLGYLYTFNGASALYHANVKKLETTAAGISITDGAATAATIGFTADDLYITNNDPDGDVYITAEKNLQGQSTILKGDPDSAAELYYAGVKAVETIDGGIKVSDGSVTSDFYQDNDILYITNRQHNGQVRISVENSTGVERLMILAAANGVDPRLYIYAGGVNVAVFTDNGSESAWNLVRGSAAGTSGATLGVNSNNKILYIRNNYDAGHINITGNTTASAAVDMIIADPDGAVELYHAGVKKFETTADGVTITDGRIEGNLLVAGNLTVSGTTFTTQTETVQISDNLLVINHGEVSTGVTEGEAGIEVDRGQAVNYRFMFDETDDYFVVGISGSEQPVATREDTPTQGYVPYWDASNYQFVNTDSPIKRTTNSGVELYHAGNSVATTLDGGFVFNSDGKYAILRVSSDDFIIRNVSDSGNIILYCNNSSTVQKTVLKANADGAVELYYAGVKTVETYTGGLIISDGADQGLYAMVGDDLSVRNLVDAGRILFYAEDTASNQDLCAIMDPDGSVDLYYAGVQTFKTTVNGARIGGAVNAQSAVNVSLTVGGMGVGDGPYYGDYGAILFEANSSATASARPMMITNAYKYNTFAILQGTTADANPSLLATGEINTGTLALAIPNTGAVELYYAGVKSFSTDSEGISVFDTSGNDPFIYFKDDAAVQVGVVAVVDGNMLLRDATDKVFVKLNAAGSAELYHNNAKKFETTATGVTVTGDVGATTMDTTAANEWSAQQGFNETAITSTSNAAAWNLTTAQCAVHTMTENTTISAPSNMQAGTTYNLRVVQAAGVYTLAWNAVFKWGEADIPTAPAASGDVVILSFYSDGTSMYGVESIREEA